MLTRPTIRDVATEAGVSLATVSLVLNGKNGVGADTRQRVLAAIDRLGYQARGDRSVVGVLVERLSIPAYSDPALSLMIQGIETEASRRGYHMMLASVETGAAALPAMVSARQVSGVVVLGGGDISDDYIRALAATGTPLVLADNVVDGLAVPCVLPDNATGANLMTRHLIDLGHQRIAILEGPRKYKTLTERREGYLRALDQADLSPDPTLLVRPIPGSARKGYLEMRALLELPRNRWPTAVFAVSDKTALGALEALKDAGLRVPDDMTLVGFDDIAESAHTMPALTTVHLPMQELGQVAVQRLVEHVEGTNVLPYKTVLYTSLVVRQSSGDRQRTMTA